LVLRTILNEMGYAAVPLHIASPANNFGPHMGFLQSILEVLKVLFQFICVFGTTLYNFLPNPALIGGYKLGKQFILKQLPKM